MQFGDHVPSSEHRRGASGAMRTFARGLSVAGMQWTFDFNNGFGASVINDGYGRESGLYELAVLDSSGNLTYETPITDDVLGFLSESEVADTLDRIQALSADDVAAEIARRSNEARNQRIAELRAELACLEAEAGESA